MREYPLARGATRGRAQAAVRTQSAVSEKSTLLVDKLGQRSGRIVHSVLVSGLVRTPIVDEAQDHLQSLGAYARANPTK